VTMFMTMMVMSVPVIMVVAPEAMIVSIVMPVVVVVVDALVRAAAARPFDLRQILGGVSQAAAGNKPSWPSPRSVSHSRGDCNCA
jgi:hypothetical protein